MAFGSAKLIKYLKDVKFSVNSYTMNQPSLVLATESIEDEEYFRTNLEKVIATRESTKLKLKSLGFQFADSKANFIFATHPNKPAEEIMQALRAEGIIVRHFKKPRIDNYLRISIGTDDEMQKLVDVLARIL